MYFNILKIPFYDNDRMCHSYIYSIRPYEIFNIEEMRQKYIELYNILIPQKINKISGFHNNSQTCFHILMVPEQYKNTTQIQVAKNDDILYIYDFLCNNGYKIQTKAFGQSFKGYHISKHFGEIIATIRKE